MPLDETVRFMLKPVDKELLRRLVEMDGDATMSATLRRLIRQEAERRGVQVEDGKADEAVAVG